MDIAFGITVFICCMWAGACTMPVHEIFYSAETKPSKHECKFFNWIYKNLRWFSLIVLNAVCFFAQFFSIKCNLTIVIWIINGMFFLSALWNAIDESYKKNYIALLQKNARCKIKAFLLYL